MSLCEARTFVPKGTPTTIEFVGGCRANSRFIPVCDPCRVIPYPNRVFNVLPGKQQRSYGKFLPGSLRAVFRFPEDNGEHRNAGKFCHSHFDSKHQRSKVRCFQSLCRRAQLARKCFRFVHVRIHALLLVAFVILAIAAVLSLSRGGETRSDQH